MFQKKYKKIVRYFSKQVRDSRYVFVAPVSTIILILSTLQAIDKGLFDSIERPIFDFFNNLPQLLDSFMYAVTQFGGAGSIVFWMAVAWLLINKRAAFTVAGAGISGWYIAKILKSLIGRGRPEALLDTLNLFADKSLGGFGFPSGHATFSAACVTVLYFQLDRKYRKYLLFIVLLVGISRMYLGAHFPLDIIGGWALGALVGSIACLVFGVSVGMLTTAQIKKAFKRKGYDMRHVQFANVDARGSRPVFLEDKDGKKYFAKIFGAQEHAADWLFKTYRFFRFKNLQAEEPYINSRRNIEIESFATLWAKQGGVRVPTIIDLVKVHSSWALLLEKLEMKSLAEHKNLRQKTLIDAWEQVKKLHSANMAHRDLRAANLMIDTSGKVWIIDFGFAEVSPQKKRQYMDIAELLMSMTLLVGVRRTVDAALEVIDPEFITKSLPYLQREVFSGATASSLKSRKHLLGELKDEIKSRFAIEDDIEEADIIRLNGKKILNVLLVGILLYVILPQLTVFRGAISSMKSLDWIWITPLIVTSFMSYGFSAFGLLTLSNVPINLLPTILVQLAGSFINKIVPGGVGAATLNARYLYKSGNESADSAAILATHNVIGFLMFSVPLGLFLLMRGENIASLLKISLTFRQAFTLLCLVAVVQFVVYVNTRLRQKIIGSILNFIASIREFTNSRTEIALTAASSFAISISYILALYCCIRAFGLPLGIAEATVIYATAIVAKTIIPTPGGLGPLEVAMVSALVSFGIDNTAAISTVVLYRLATFWLPIPFSLAAYRYVTRHKLI